MTPIRQKNLDFMRFPKVALLHYYYLITSRGPEGDPYLFQLFNFFLVQFKFIVYTRTSQNNYFIY